MYACTFIHNYNPSVRIINLNSNATYVVCVNFILNICSNLFIYLKVQSFRLIMENNFIQMAASAGHAVAYTIGPIFNRLCAAVFHKWLNEYCSLKR